VEHVQGPDDRVSSVARPSASHTCSAARRGSWNDGIAPPARRARRTSPRGSAPPWTRPRN